MLYVALPATLWNARACLPTTTIHVLKSTVSWNVPSLKAQHVAQKPAAMHYEHESRTGSIQLMRDIRQCRSFLDVAVLVRAMFQYMDYQHLSAVLSRLPHLDETKAVAKPSIPEDFNGSLHQLLWGVHELRCCCTSRELSSCIYVLGKFRWQPTGGLLEDILGELIRKVELTGPQDVSNCCWGLARLKYADERVWACLSGRAVALMPCMKAQELVNTIWAAAHVRHVHLPLFETAAVLLSGMLKQLEHQHVALVLWAFAKSHYYDRPLFDILCKHVVGKRQIEKQSGQGLALIAWSLATVGHRDAYVTQRLARASRMKLTKLTGQGWSNLVWGLYKLGYRETWFYASVGKKAVVKVDRLKPLGLATLVSALGAVQPGGVSGFLEKAALEVVRGAQGFRPHTMVATLVGFTRCGYLPKAVLCAALPVLEGQVASLSCKQKLDLLWVLSSSNAPWVLPLVAALVSLAEESMATGHPRHVLALLWGLGTLGRQDSHLWKKLLVGISGNMAAWPAPELVLLMKHLALGYVQGHLAYPGGAWLPAAYPPHYDAMGNMGTVRGCSPQPRKEAASVSYGKATKADVMCTSPASTLGVLYAPCNGQLAQGRLPPPGGVRTRELLGAASGSTQHRLEIVNGVDILGQEGLGDKSRQKERGHHGASRAGALPYDTHLAAFDDEGVWVREYGMGSCLQPGPETIAVAKMACGFLKEDLRIMRPSCLSQLLLSLVNLGLVKGPFMLFVVEVLIDLMGSFSLEDLVVLNRALSLLQGDAPASCQYLMMLIHEELLGQNPARRCSQQTLQPLLGRTFEGPSSPSKQDEGMLPARGG